MEDREAAKNAIGYYSHLRTINGFLAIPAYFTSCGGASLGTVTSETTSAKIMHSRFWSQVTRGQCSPETETGPSGYERPVVTHTGCNKVTVRPPAFSNVSV